MTHDIDTRLRDAWHQGGEALTPSMQGRLRAARRTALSASPAAAHASSSPLSRLRWIGMPATALAAVFAVAVLVPRGGNAPVTPVIATQSPDPVTEAGTQPVLAGHEGLELLTLEDDPDFYLWLASDETLTTIREASNESI